VLQRLVTIVMDDCLFKLPVFHDRRRSLCSSRAAEHAAVEALFTLMKRSETFLVQVRWSPTCFFSILFVFQVQYFHDRVPGRLQLKERARHEGNDCCLLFVGVASPTPTSLPLSLRRSLVCSFGRSPPSCRTSWTRASPP
jgi:hypothetical protein